MTKRNALGRGLSAILSDPDEISSEQSATETGSAGTINQIPVIRIEKNPFQPRTHFPKKSLLELAGSIKVHGIIQPVTVRKLGYDRYQLISGERRLEAAKLAGLAQVPAFIRITGDTEALEMALVENIQREDLNPIEIAAGYRRLIEECNLTQENLAEKVGKDRTTVTNYLRLLKLLPEIQAALRDGKITMGHARALINVQEADLQLDLFKKITDGDLSVRSTEDLVRTTTGRDSDQSRTLKSVLRASDSDKFRLELNAVEEKLRNHLGTKVDIRNNSRTGKGEIRIHYFSDEDLNRLLELLNGSLL